MKNIINKILVFGGILSMIFFISCSDNLPSNVDSTDEVVLKSIKILNAGIDGKTVLEGIIDENTKTVKFPRIDPRTDVSAIRFEAEMSNGAKLDKETYPFVFEENKDRKEIIIKVINGSRFREYAVTLRLNIPVFGADWEKAMYYDYSGNDLGNPTYETFKSSLTRGSGFDGEYVLIVTRATGGSHLLKVEDLKKNVINPIPLNLKGVAGGTFPVNVGSKHKGHTLIANLSGKYGMKIYHWGEDPNAESTLIFNDDPVNYPGMGIRHGDNMSSNLDENGNGYIFFADNKATEITRFTVSNFTKITEVKVLPIQKGITMGMSMNRVEKTDDYLQTSFYAPIYVVNKDGGLLYTLSDDTTPNLQGSDARIFTFNGERYLMMTTAPRMSGSAVLYIYDITKGANTVEALQLFEKGDKKPLLQYSIGGGVNTSPSTQTGYYITKNEKGEDVSLMLYTASNDAGFALIEVPKKSLED